jgi:hypothetical protein
MIHNPRDNPCNLHSKIPDPGVLVLWDRPTSQLIDPDQLGDERLG